MVLLTDGAETCDPNNTDFLVQKALEANWFGIRTFVLGAPGSDDARGILEAWQAGGGGVVTYNGRMIENLHVESAQRILALHEAIAALQA